MNGHRLNLERAEAFGATVAGPRHRYRREPNQDAWAPLRGRYFRGVVVADGLGSSSHGSRGARFACRATQIALKTWTRTGAPLETLGPLIETTWTDLLGDTTARDAQTTCLFGALSPDGYVVLGQVGDGLVAVATESDLVASTPSRHGFGNETHALGGETGWRMERVPFPDSAALLLATDGVADDLSPHTTGDFVRHVIGDYGPLPRTTRWRRLAADLHAWPVPCHLDDKTIAALYLRP